MAEDQESESAAAAHLVDERETALGAGDHHLRGKDGKGQAPVSENKRACGAAGVCEDEEAMVSTEEEVGGNEGATEEVADSDLECTLDGFSGETCSSSVGLTCFRIQDNGEKGLFDIKTGEEDLTSTGGWQVSKNGGKNIRARLLEIGSEEDVSLASKIPARLIMNDHHLVTRSPMKAELSAVVAVTLVDKVEEVKYTHTSCMNRDESTNPMQKSLETTHSASSAKSAEKDQPASDIQLKECFLAGSLSAPSKLLKQKAEIEVKQTSTRPIALLEEEEEAEVAPTSPAHLATTTEDSQVSVSHYNINIPVFSSLALETAITTESDGKPQTNTKLPNQSDDLAEDCAQEYPGSPMDLDEEASQDGCENSLTGKNLEAETSSARLAVLSQGSKSRSDGAGNLDPNVTAGVCNGGIAETDLSTNQTYLSHGTVTFLGSTAEDSSLPYSLEFEKHWKATEDNPSNFAAWTNLLDYVEQQNYIVAARKAYAAFFTRYPYCYGYWKKYTDMERRFGNLKEAEEVFEQSLQAIPLSVDLWMHFITFLQETLDLIQPEAVQRIRNVFEMALAAAGMDFHSDKLWETYIKWEKTQGDLQAVTVLYDRLLATPTQLYSHHFEKFKEHVTSNSPVDIVSKEEFMWLKSKLMPEAESTVNMGNRDEQQVHEASEEAAQVAEVEKKSDVGLGNMKDLIISLREKLYKQNEPEVSKRWTFEQTIKRPYFHVKPLERAQLINWNNYLDFEISNGSHSRTIVLFERCVIACAQYEEFWMKYTKYLENHTVVGTRSVFQRSCLYHLPKKPNLHLLWAAFEERQGDIKQARNIMKTLDEAVPGMAMVRLRRVSLERRAGNMEAAEALLRDSILQSEGTSLGAFYSIKMARQMLKVQKNLGKAREILQEALKKDPDNTKLYLNLLEVEFSADPKHNEANTINCIESVLSSNLPGDAKIVFSQRRVEFLEDFGSSIHSLLTAYDDHQKLLKLHAPKRKVEENGTTEETEEKKAKIEETTSTPAVTAPSSTPLIVGDTSTNQVGASAAYNYNTWYQNYGAYNYQNAWNYNYFPQS